MTTLAVANPKQRNPESLSIRCRCDLHKEEFRLLEDWDSKRKRWEDSDRNYNSILYKEYEDALEACYIFKRKISDEFLMMARITEQEMPEAFRSWIAHSTGFQDIGELFHRVVELEEQNQELRKDLEEVAEALASILQPSGGC